MSAPMLFFDIVGPNMAKQAAFYRAVFGWDIGADGRFTVSSPAMVQATLREEANEQTEKVLYFGVDDVTATLGKVTAHGGQIVAPRFEIKGVVVLGLFKDPAGNLLGLIETAEGKPKVP